MTADGHVWDDRAWIGSHVRALAFMGGLLAQRIPDNPRVGVGRANWCEPGLNRTYLDLATLYHTAIPRKSRSACWWSSAG